MKYNIVVKTGSRKGPLIEEDASGNLTIYLREKPHDGEANSALINLLSKHFKAPKTSIKILSGAKSHQKTVEIPN